MQIRRRYLPALLAGTVALTTAGMTSVVSADSGKEWTIYGGDYANTRYSALDQINTGNVKDLKVSWIHSLGSTHPQERRLW